jgi:hypothetical protein
MGSTDGAAAPAEAALPLTPSDCDLRNFLRMPLQVGRLLDSTTWIDAAADPRLGHALMSLWAASWQQVPAGSLPDSDAVLCRMSMCPDMAEWLRIKPRVLAAWRRCADGRLYHPVVCEMALEGWLTKLAAKLNGGKGNATMHGSAFDEAGVLARVREAHDLLVALNPNSEALKKARDRLKLAAGRGGVQGAAVGGPGGRPGGRLQAAAPGAGVAQAGPDLFSQAPAPAMQPAGQPPMPAPLQLHAPRERLANAKRTHSKRKGREGIYPPYPPQSPPVDNFAHTPGLQDPAPGPLPAQAAAALHGRWWETRRGIEGAGHALGVGGWDEAASQCGAGEHWPAYRERVFSAAGGDGPWWREVPRDGSARPAAQWLHSRPGVH